MTSVLELRIPIEQFALAHTFETISDLHVEIERFAAHDLDSVMPFVWVTANDFDMFKRVIAEDPSVESSSRLTDCDDKQFYRMSWINDEELVVHLLLEKDRVITAAQTSGEFWELRVMCPEHDTLSKVYEFCEEHGLSLAVDAIYELENTTGSKHGLTESQYMSLIKAREMGYYDVPREVSLTELAEELKVSHQALSERLRRGHGNLIDRNLSSTDNV